MKLAPTPTPTRTPESPSQDTGRIDPSVPGGRVAQVDAPTTLVSRTIDYTYDGLHRLIGADYDNGDYYAYSYDAVGNRLSLDSDVNGLPASLTYIYDIANRLTAVGEVEYTWDDNGNLLDDGVNEYTYDTANRLLTVSGESLTASYGYNGLGERLEQTVNSQATEFVVDLNGGLSQVLSDGTNMYTYGLNRTSQVAGSEAEYFLSDALGSVRQVTDESGDVALARSYDPYGSVAQEVAFQGVETSYGFTGEFSDSFTKLINLRSRMYSPSTGTFLTRDSWQGDYNRPQSMERWGYGYGNPVNLTDPTGHSPVTGGNEGVNERDLTWWLYQELITNANSWYAQRIKTLMAGSLNHKARALKAFATLVQDRAKWDFKHKIRDELSSASIVLIDNIDGYHWYEYSVPGNINFGFVGRASGIPGWMLHAGATYAEMKDPAHLPKGSIANPFKGECPCPCPEGNAGETCRKYLCWYINPLWVRGGFDDPKDYNAVETGIQLYDRYHANMTFPQFVAGITARGSLMDRPSVTPDWEWKNPIGGWPYSAGHFNGPREAEFEPTIQQLLGQ